ncbi:hypothetical protein [Parasedimentitalea huanghaiensis]|uniref:Uncharacterized protein n=1 Tax=Parasedimentitalea huanghaiensis TaxID=2682100 RepID=A0A6L6WP44_9RHOB|nr:hypothetical protein [Zongyanglinia huanghaiensis]MVO17392.1 hypothetical protein [Zongyanglinia huanghaiensis]
MTDLSNFDPNSVDDLLERIFDDVKDVGKEWLNENSDVVGGYFRSLAEAALQTRFSLEAGKISAEYADQVLHMQQAAFRQTIKYTRFMTLVLSQKIVDTVFTIIAYVIMNKTGLNLFPELAKNT